MTDQFAPVERFYREIIDLPIPTRPARLSPERKAAALEHWREETKEFEDAETLEDEIDAALDLAWLAIGRVIEMGADVDGHWGELVRANMGRVRGQSAKRPNSMGFDAVKPEGWVGPDHASIIARTRPPRVLLLGHGRHGKDSVAEFLRDDHGLRFQSSSMFCAERVMLPAFRAIGISYADAEACYEDRHGRSDQAGDHRTFWYDNIRAYNDPDPTRLAREMMEENDIYVGMRSADEYRACMKAGVFDHVVWVERPGTPLEARSSFDIDLDFTRMWIVRNDGTLEDLRETTARLVSPLGLSR